MKDTLIGLLDSVIKDIAQVVPSDSYWNDKITSIIGRLETAKALRFPSEIPSGTLNDLAFAAAAEAYAKAFPDATEITYGGMRAAIAAYLAALPSEILGDNAFVREQLRKIKRMSEMSAGLMRDKERTGGWDGSERVAKQFDRLSWDADAAIEIIDNPPEPPKRECSEISDDDLVPLMTACAGEFIADAIGMGNLDRLAHNMLDVIRPYLREPKREIVEENESTITDDDRHFQYEGPNQECGKD